MDLTLTTPTLLFPALSLLLLAYTNRFLTLANLIRELLRRYRTEPGVAGQIANLRRRVYIIREMQDLGIASLFGCVLCMFLLFAGQLLVGEIVFGMVLVLILLSLSFSFWENLISVDALQLQLQDMDPHGSHADWA